MSKKLYREYDNEGNLIKKECGECREIKMADDFIKNKCKKDGIDSICKSCAKERHRQYYENNKDEINERHRQYYENNKDKIKERRRQYCENNKDKIKEQKRQWRENNKDKIKEYYENHKDELKEYKQQWRDNNKDKVLEQQRQWYEKNKDKVLERDRQYRENNKDKVLEQKRQYREKNKDRISEWHRQYHENISKEEILRIYENVTKERYPRNGIQYGIIYGVHCIPTDKWYIGQTTTSFNIRYQGDFFKYKAGELSEDNKKAQLLQEDIEKYGQESFEIFEVIDVAFSEKELDEKEAYYIEQYKAYDEGYNSNRGNIFKHNKLKRREENDYQREGISRIC